MDPPTPPPSDTSSQVATPGHSSTITVMPSPAQMVTLDRAREVAGSASLKFDRAVGHIHTLDGEIQAYLDRKPYRLVCEDYSANGLDKLWRVQVHEPIPQHLAVILGDCVQNLRSALDHMIWELSRRHSGVEVERTEFPIFRVHDAYHVRKKGGDPERISGLHKVRGMSPPAQAVVEAFQPYNLGDEAEAHPLWLLHELSNMDKHRTLLLTATAVERPEFGFTIQENVEMTWS